MQGEQKAYAGFFADLLVFNPRQAVMTKASLFVAICGITLLVAANRCAADAGDPNHPNGTTGLILIDKIGSHVRFFNPSTWTEVVSIEMPDRPNDFASPPIISQLFTKDNRLARKLLRTERAAVDLPKWQATLRKGWGRAMKDQGSVIKVILTPTLSAEGEGDNTAPSLAGLAQHPQLPREELDVPKPSCVSPVPTGVYSEHRRCTTAARKTRRRCALASLGCEAGRSFLPRWTLTFAPGRMRQGFQRCRADESIPAE